MSDEQPKPIKVATDLWPPVPGGLPQVSKLEWMDQQLELVAAHTPLGTRWLTNSSTRREAERIDEYRNKGYIVGAPMPTPWMSRERLEADGLVGIYVPIEEPKTSRDLSDQKIEALFERMFGEPTGEGK